MRAIKFGQFLHKNKITSVLNDGVKSVGRNKISVEFSSGQAANEFIDNPILDTSNFTAFIPTFNITRMGLVRGVPTDWHLDEFIDSLELPAGCGEILKARRLNRKVTTDSVVTWIPTQSVVLTFRGQTLPPKIFSYHTSLPIHTYRLPTIQCLNCCRFGHIKDQCRSKPRCFKCSQPHSGESCEIETENSSCLLCSGKHMATNKSCPEHSRQQSIKMLMSEENLSYQDASARFPPVRRSYADMTKELFTKPTYSPVFSIPNSNRVHYPQTPRNSYRQTIFRTPRPRLQPTKGYDRQAHHDIIRNCPTSFPNGSALNIEHDYALPPDDRSIPSLTNSLKNILENINQHPLPPNVAQIIIKIASLLNNGVHGDNSME
ncbi:jg16555 [Pararge aegeria aegeria]|uniref:Jg16555 protein n=1 Tax=Pararge aegeria aegeria TaxID=348720 RepID=A0A8S4QXF6_9NEOP|nr:jg16555 [Pararge aegeria aegeria]